jgi:hypothetical protein
VRQRWRQRVCKLKRHLNRCGELVLLHKRGSMNGEGI